MANTLTDQLMFALADAAGMALRSAPKDPKIAGAGTITIDMAGLPVTFNPKVVSAHSFDRMSQIIVKIHGNLAMLITARDTRKLKLEVKATLINIAKIDSATSLWLERHKPKNHDDAVRILASAAVKTFDLDRKTWVPAV